MTTHAIETTNLTYRFAATQRVGLENINLKIAWGTTNLLVGPNGAGKSTLLKILAGKTLIKQGTLKLGGFDPFEFSINRNEQHNSDINNFITYLGTEWASNPVVKRDIPVKLLISSIGGEIYAERRDKLIDILDLDPDWLMSAVSDGERRRVQLAMGLLKPWKLLLLDEVTVDLDVVVRQKLLNFLREETRTRAATVVYATHIFDGLGSSWWDHLIHLRGGMVVDEVLSNQLEFKVSGDVKTGKVVEVGLSESLHPLALHWLNEDLVERGSREEEKLRRAKRHNEWDNERDGHYFDAGGDKLKDYFKGTRSNK